MKIGLLQSSYLPWLGYFDQIVKSDLFVFYDDVQFEDRSWRNRNKIKTSNGWCWLTVPILKTGRFGQKILDVKINTTMSWQKKHLRALQINYNRAPYLKRYYHDLADILNNDWEVLSRLNIELIKYFCDVMGINTKFISSDKLQNIKGQKTLRIKSICKALGANEVILGAKARNYLDEKMLLDEGITIEYQEYHHPEYTQLYSPFIPYLSIVDLLFNEGDNSLEILYDKKGINIVRPGENK